MSLRPSPAEPYSFQLDGAEFLRGNRAILADEPGVGKTRQALMAARGRTLVVAPAGLQYEWESQVARWMPDIDWTFAPYHSLARRRAATNERGTQVRLATREPAEAFQGPWDTVIADEAHNLKGRKAAWTLAFEKIAAQTGQVSLLTGTPIPNWGHEIYMPLRLLNGPKDRRTSSYWRWIETWFQMKANYFSGRMSEIGDLLPGLTWDDFAMQLDGRYLRRENPVELPELVHQSIEVAMVPAQARAYQQMKKELMAELGAETVLAWHPGSAHTLLLKIATGLECMSDSKGSGKLDVLAELMVDRAATQTVLFCHFRRSAEAVAARIGGEFIHGGVPTAERDRRVAVWRSGGFAHLVCTYAVGAEGHNWSHANCVVRVEATARPSVMGQAAKRVHRLGQRERCHLIDLVTRGSVDQRLRELLARKSDQQMAVLTALDLLA